MHSTDLIVNRANLSQAEVVETPLPDQLAPGSCLLRIDRFALTSNNITYAVAPDVLQYWSFFPVDRDGWGRVPVWGYADVVESAHPEVAEGARVYGYLPMSTHLVIEPAQVSRATMMDGAAHRQPMSPIYNQYLFTSADPVWSPGAEALISLFRPLFTTSFLLDDLHRSNGFFGAERAVLSSASSKTAMALAHLMKTGGGVEVVGLTSAGNVGFVEGLGCYDRVLSYDRLEDIPDGPACFVDMAGNADVLRRVHVHFGDALKNSCRVGLTHWQDVAGDEAPLPGPKPEFFFAPAYAQQRIADWGRDGFLQRSGAAWAGFAETGAGWVSVTEDRGPEAVKAHYLEMLSGKVDPREGLFLSMQG